MLRNKLNLVLSEYAGTLSPKDAERMVISDIYGAIREALIGAECCQIGSYPRFTAITPVHDLDILYCLGDWHGPKNPQEELFRLALALNMDSALHKKLPDIKSIQAGTHSVCIEFSDAKKPTIDIVPCYRSGTMNDFQQPVYWVPEIAHLSSRERQNKVWDAESPNGWILSDPKGYIKLAQILDAETSVFRKTVKIVKKWKTDLRQQTGLKLKSFHLEQLVGALLEPGDDMVSMIIKIFREIPNAISHSGQIPDRAEPDRYIDDYVDEFSDDDRKCIEIAVKNTLLKLEHLDDVRDIDDVFLCDISRLSPNEELITYDYDIIPCANPDDNSAEIKCDNYPNRAMRSKIDDEGLYFKLTHGARAGIKYYYKVSNSHIGVPLNEWRGEITEGQTKNNPEKKKFGGVHQVECYAVNDKNECISYYRYLVELVAKK